VPHAQRAPQPVEQPRRLGERQLATVEQEDLLVKEGQRLVGLLHAAQWVLLRLSHLLEEPADIGVAQFARVALVREEHETAHPVRVPLPWLRPAEVSQRRLTDLVEQAGRCDAVHQGLWKCGCGHGLPSLKGS
jgi:hypothetical protein